MTGSFRRTALVTAALVLFSGTLVACGSSSDDSGSTSKAETASTSTTSSATGLDELTAKLDAAKQVPKFTFDGQPIDARVIAKGKSIADIPFTTGLEYEADIAKAMQQAGSSVGLKVDVVQTNGPETWAPAIENSVAKGVDLVHLSSADPTAVRPQLQDAKNKGVKVMSSHYWDSSETSQGDAAGLDAWTGIDYVTPAKLLADWVITQSNADAKVLVIGEPEFTFNDPVLAGIKSQFEQYCPKCSVDVVNVPAADWQTKIPTEVSNAVQQKGIDYVIPFIDGMVPGVQDGLRRVGAQDKVKIATYGATPFAVDLVRKGQVGINCGYSVNWTGYAFLDQVLRVLGDKPTDADHNIDDGLRCFDESNASEAGTPAKAGEGFGTAYKTGYEQLWGGQ